MRRILVWVVIVSAALILDPVAQACGFKLLPLGRGIRYQSRHTPRAGSVLLYLPTTGSGRSLTDPNLESALREAGHAVRAVTTRADLENALRSGDYDVILANVTDAPDLETAQAVVEGHAVVLPALYLVAPSGQQPAGQQTDADRAKLRKSFSVVVEIPSRPGHYCTAVDKAMELKLKRGQATSTRR